MEKKIIAIFLGFFILNSALNGAVVKLEKTSFTLLRNYADFTQLPKLKAENKGNGVATYQVTATLIDKNGKVKLSSTHSITVPGKSAAELKPFGDNSPVISNEAMLFKAEITAPDKKQILLSGIFGKEKVVPVNVADVFGMNVHLGRYTPEVRWKLLRMLKEAGVTSVRVDCGFRVPGSVMAKEQLPHVEEVILGLEAFGIRPMTVIAYFPREFYKNSEKMKMAYDWAAILAKKFKGRTDWHYGNETNSGWAAFGAVADMAALNKSFALGTASGDTGALRASFGIAEGLYNYVKEFIKCDVLSYLEAICVHPYCGTPEAGMAKCLATKKLIASYGSKAQVWATEVGFHIDEKSSYNKLTGELTGVMGFSKLHQQQLLPRLFILAQSYGIERVYWYDFFGLRDPETFWLIDKDFKPLPSYQALVECSKRLKDTVPAGCTSVESLVQRHVFKRKNGSILMVCWALTNDTKADFKLPSEAKIFDDLGQAVKLPANGILTLGHGVLYIEGIAATHLPKLINEDVIVSTMDKRHFGSPMSRFTVKAGSKFKVPFAVFNGCKKTVEVKPRVRRTYPGWKVSVPMGMTIEAGRQKNDDFEISVPAGAVPGVEYKFVLGADVDGLQMAYPYSVRVKVAGNFSYNAIERFNQPANYPMWDAIDETKAGKGNPVLTAKNGKAVIDGDLKEWSPDEFYPIDQKFQWVLRDPGVLSDDDWSGKVALRWDSKHIYAAFLVKDEHLCFVDFLSRDWRDNDNIRLFFSSVEDEKKRSNNISDNDILLIMTPTGVAHTEGPMVNVASIGGKVRPKAEGKIKMSSKVWTNGYVMEVAVPVSEFNLVPKAGMAIGFNCMADDIDDGFRQHVAMTYFKNPGYWNSPKALGRLKLK